MTLEIFLVFFISYVLGSIPFGLILARIFLDKDIRKIGSKNIEMAGKTGTVQVVRISEAEREKGLIKNEDRPWEKRDHALFVGYAPVSNPKYAISIVVEHGGSGSSTAAPIRRAEPVGLSFTFLTGVEGGLVSGSKFP